MKIIQNLKVPGNFLILKSMGSPQTMKRKLIGLSFKKMRNRKRKCFISDIS
jgi:hypothetical protein